jgi:CRP-like cAMP-binding protein
VTAKNHPRDSDLELLTRLKALSWLHVSELTMLAAAMVPTNFKRRQVIVDAIAGASDAHILLSGIARMSCLNARGERVTAALLPPGPIFDFPVLPLAKSQFRCEAYTNCRVGRLSWSDFDRATANASGAVFRKFHENDLKQWYRLLLRSSSLLKLDLHERIATVLLELCADFGIEDSRGTLLRVPVSHREIGNLVGASRPRVTEHLARLERDNLVIRQGRQLIVCASKLNASMNLYSD